MFTFNVLVFSIKKKLFGYVVCSTRLGHRIKGMPEQSPQSRTKHKVMILIEMHLQWYFLILNMCINIIEAQ